MRISINCVAASLCILMCIVGAAAQSPKPLDDETLGGLIISGDPAVISLSMQPGSKQKFELVYFGSFYFKPVSAQVEWSVVPTDGAQINPRTGEFTIAQSTLSGSVFDIKADVENGRRVISKKVYVYTPETNPLVGSWKEKAQLTCKDNVAWKPEVPIYELEFHADGRFAVTFIPLEIKRDYWGAYSFDPKRGSLKLSVEGGNDVPSEMDGEGTFSIEKDGGLKLHGMWLGSPNQQEVKVDKPDICSVVFVRSH